MAQRVVLLVDDNARFAKLTKTYLLTGEGFTDEVVVARDGAEDGEHLLRSERSPSEMPCLALLDLNMPRLDGFGVLKNMREEVDTRFVPVVIVTSSNHPQDARRAYEMGANGHLDKLSDGVPRHEGVRTMACN